MFSFSNKEFKCALLNKYYIHCLRFPGLWLSDRKLAHLRETIERITLSELGALPEYGVYLPSRDPYKNRIVTLVYEKDENKPVAFAAMVHCHVKVRVRIHPVVHLGLVIKSKSSLRRNLLFLIYYYPLIYIFILRGCLSFWITSVSMEPSIIGAIADNFRDVYPHYLGITQANGMKLSIARAFVSDYGHEFGIGPKAVLDQNRFVIKDSCRGPSEVLSTSYKKSAKYRDPRCNTYCKDTIDYEQGDELLQIGRLNLNSILVGSVHKLKADWKRKHHKCMT